MVFQIESCTIVCFFVVVIFFLCCTASSSGSFDVLLVTQILDMCVFVGLTSTVQA